MNDALTKTPFIGSLSSCVYAMYAAVATAIRITASHILISDFIFYHPILLLFFCAQGITGKFFDKISVLIKVNFKANE